MATIPIMVKSCKCNLNNININDRKKLGECENDPGGYFIINGKERAIVS